eukprot:5111394-Pyramimonas_sp.AAC.1
MSNTFHNLRRRREDAVIVVGMVSIDAFTGRVLVAANIATNIATIINVLPVVDVATMPRLPKFPTRTEVPAGMCPEISAAAAASVAPNSLGAARACMRGLARSQGCASQRRALIAIAAAW